MNVKTTIVLLILLAGVGGYLYFTQDKEPTDDKKKVDEHKLVDLKKEDVTKLVISPSDGKPIVVEKDGTNWKLTQPVAAAADTFEVGSLVDGILGLTTTAEVNTQGASAPKTGTDKPQFTVDVSAGGKTTTLRIGNKLAVSNSMYVLVKGQSAVQVCAADLLEKLDRPASDLRQAKLIEAASNDIKQVTIMHKGGPTITLQKMATEWKIVQPTNVNADSAAVTDLLGAITGLRATSFVEDVSSTSGLAAPRTTVFFSTQAPSTQPVTPATTIPAGVTIAFGGYDDVLKKNVFVKLSDSPAVVKVAATSVDSFNKTVLELRDKTVVSLVPKEVSRFSVTTVTPAATQPTTRAASNNELRVERRGARSAGDPPMTADTMARAPTSMPTGLANFHVAWPGATASPWVLVSAGKADADIGDVNAFLDALHPLKADKFVDKPAPTTQPAASYVVKATTVAAGGQSSDFEIRFVDRGGDQPLLGDYNGLGFEVPRTVLPNLTKDFKLKPANANPGPSTANPSFPGGLP